jgi:hypothetical protein
MNSCASSQLCLTWLQLWSCYLDHPCLSYHASSVVVEVCYLALRKRGIFPDAIVGKLISHHPRLRRGRHLPCLQQLGNNWCSDQLVLCARIDGNLDATFCTSREASIF